MRAKDGSNRLRCLLPHFCYRLPMTKAASIHNALERQIKDITRMESLLAKALAKSAKRNNFNLSEIEVKKLTTAFISARDGKLELDLDPPCGLGKSEAEIRLAVETLAQDLEVSVTEIIEDINTAVSQAVPEAASRIADLISDQLEYSALENASQLHKAQAERIEAVRRIWGSALDKLDFLRHIVLEWSQEASVLRSGPYMNSNTSFALGRLVFRVYELAGEIITLARAGYADGALARWRSLHEVCVVAMFLAKQSDRCAQMYLSHHQVEELRLLDVDKASGTVNVHDMHHDRYIGHLRRRKAAMVNVFGPVFANDYGWASIELGRTKTTFRDLESHVGLETLRRGYQRANSTVHGGALATLTRISLGMHGIHDGPVPPAYGCEVAANYVAASLSMLIGELCLTTENMDLLALSIVVHKHAEKIRDQITQTYGEFADDSLRRRILQRKGERQKIRVKRRRIQKSRP